MNVGQKGDNDVELLFQVKAGYLLLMCLQVVLKFVLVRCGVLTGGM